MANVEYAHEFDPMIIAVPSCAVIQKGTDHPQRAVKDSRLYKAAGRVFLTDNQVEDAKALGSKLGGDAFQPKIWDYRLAVDFSASF